MHLIAWAIAATAAPCGIDSAPPLPSRSAAVQIGGSQAAAAAAAGDADGLRRLRADVESELNALRNAAYAAGYAAAKGAIAAMVSGQYS